MGYVRISEGNIRVGPDRHRHAGVQIGEDGVLLLSYHPVPCPAGYLSGQGRYNQFKEKGRWKRMQNRFCKIGVERDCSLYGACRVFICARTRGPCRGLLHLCPGPCRTLRLFQTGRQVQEVRSPVIRLLLPLPALLVLQGGTAPARVLSVPHGLWVRFRQILAFLLLLSDRGLLHI